MLQRTLRLYRNAYQGLSAPVWLLAGVMLINRCGTMVLPFMALYLTQHLHYSVTDAGMVMAVYGTGAFIGTFLGGRLTDRFGFYYVQLFSLLFGGLFLLLLQFVTNFYALCGSVFVFTLLGDSFRPANQTAISYYSGAETRTRAFSLNRLAINLGWTVGGGLGGWIASISYSLLFWVDGLTCVVAGLVLWSSLPVPAHKTAGPDPLLNPVTDTGLPSTASSPYADQLFRSFVVCATLYLIAFMQLFTMVPLFCKQILLMSEGSIGTLMALNGLIIVAVEMALVYGLERLTQAKLRLVSVGVGLASVSYAALALFDGSGLSPLSLALVFIGFVTLSEMLTIPFMQSFAVERSSPANRGQYLALYSMGGALAQTLAPAFGSQMVAHFGFSTHWWAISGLGLLSMGGFGWLARQQTRSKAVSPPVTEPI